MAEQLTGEVTELLQELIRNQCVNDGSPESGEEERSATLLRDYLEGTGLDFASFESLPGRRSLVVGGLPTGSTATAEVQSFDGNTARLEMQVGAGFYVRALAHDLGEGLGCGAVLVALRRTQSGEFSLDRAVPLADVLQAPREQLASRLVPFGELLAELPSVQLKSVLQLSRLKNGVEMTPADVVAPMATLPPIVRLFGPDGDLVGLARPGKTPGCLHGWIVL